MEKRYFWFTNIHRDFFLKKSLGKPKSETKYLKKQNHFNRPVLRLWWSWAEKTPISTHYPSNIKFTFNCCVKSKYFCCGAIFYITTFWLRLYVHFITNDQLNNVIYTWVTFLLHISWGKIWLNYWCQQDIWSNGVINCWLIPDVNGRKRINIPILYDVMWSITWHYAGII